MIGGRVIAPGDGQHSYTISTSALALLRTLESDHVRQRPMADQLILHCGMIYMWSCPIGIDWSVRHLDDDRVRVSDVVTRDDSGTADYPQLVVEFAGAGYRRQIAAFAQSAKDLFTAGSAEEPSDEYEREVYEQFWREYDQRLSASDTLAK